LLPDEQKGCRRNTRGTKDQLLIDKMVLKNCRRRHTNLNMAWIDYKKAYDMVPHSWILESVTLVGIADNIKRLLKNSMDNWKTELNAYGTMLGEVNIRRGIFQGDSLSPLLFIIAIIPLTRMLRQYNTGYQLGDGHSKINHLLFLDDLKLYGRNDREIESLVHTVRIFSEDIGMQFGIEKCATIKLQRGKVKHTEGIVLPNAQVIREVNEDDYKYLGVLETDQIKHDEMKDKVKTEYLRWIRRVLQSKLNGGNTIGAINTWAVSLVRYTAGIINWRKDELEAMDRKTRKMMTIYNSLHPRADMDRLYIPRKYGGRGLISIQESIYMEEQSLSRYIDVSEEELLAATRRENILNDWNGEDNKQLKHRLRQSTKKNG